MPPPWLQSACKSDSDSPRKSPPPSKQQVAPQNRLGHRATALLAPGETSQPPQIHKPPATGSTRRHHFATSRQTSRTGSSKDAAAAATPSLVATIPEFSNRRRAAQC